KSRSALDGFNTLRTRLPRAQTLCPTTNRIRARQRGIRFTRVPAGASRLEYHEVLHAGFAHPVLCKAASDRHGRSCRMGKSAGHLRKAAPQDSIGTAARPAKIVRRTPSP